MSGAVLKLEAVWRLLGGGDGSRGSFRLALRRGALRSAALLRDLLVLLLRRFRAGRSRGHGGLRGLFGRGARQLPERRAEGQAEEVRGAQESEKGRRKTAAASRRSGRAHEGLPSGQNAGLTGQD